MQRKRRTRILIEHGQEDAIQMANQVETEYEIEVISEPAEALTMIKMRETAQNSLFYAGELLITEAKVRIQGKIGIGIVKGHQPELAHALAVIDAAFTANLPQVSQWIPILESLEEQGEQEWLVKQDRLAKTKVSFETMNQ